MWVYRQSTAQVSAGFCAAVHGAVDLHAWLREGFLDWNCWDCVLGPLPLETCLLLLFQGHFWAYPTRRKRSRHV